MVCQGVGQRHVVCVAFCTVSDSLYTGYTLCIECSDLSKVTAYEVQVHLTSSDSPLDRMQTLRFVSGHGKLTIMAINLCAATRFCPFE